MECEIFKVFQLLNLSPTSQNVILGLPHTIISQKLLVNINIERIPLQVAYYLTD